MAPLKYSGSSMFRQRIIASILSNRMLKIDKIRENEEETTGLQDFEASFLRLIESITDGTIFPLYNSVIYHILLRNPH
jgi:RNA 3'-terminal phosphate cyclase-like protein